MQTEKNRLDYIDRARGILIILVVIGHIWQSGHVFNTIYVFHMPAFFVISGLLLRFTKSHEKGIGRFICRRMFSFGLPFVFIECLGILTGIIRHGVTLTWKGYLFNTLTFHFNDPNLWFIVNLFLVEVIFAVLVLTIRNKWAVAAIISALFFAAFLLDTENAYAATLSSGFRYLPFFAIGYYCRDLLETRSGLLMILSAAAVLCAGVFLGTRDSQFNLKNLTIMACGVLGTYLVLQIARNRFPPAFDRFLRAAGRNSITVFGTHHIIYATVGVLLEITDYAATPVWAGIIMLGAVALLEIPIIYIVNHWLPFLAGKHYTRRSA